VVDRSTPAPRAALVPASRVARCAAAAIDLVLLGGIDAAVLSLTLQISGLGSADLFVLPAVPMLSFLLLLNAGYLAAFTIAGGRTIGKMATGIRVVAESGEPVDAAAGVLRALGSIVTALTLGLPYLPALLSPHGRALADRLAGTRVVHVA
jgi:uncharacterized RDD family membrane protein YckC